MNCAVHSEVDATGYCRNCGKPMCPACIRPVRDVLYCEDCLATILGHSAPPAAQVAPAGFSQQPSVAAIPAAVPAGIGPNPVLAFFLGFLPGLGAFYNEQYGKGMIHLAIFLVLFIAGVNGAMSGGAEAAPNTPPDEISVIPIWNTNRNSSIRTRFRVGKSHA